AEAEAAQEPPAPADRAKLMEFYERRASARAALGRLRDAIEDAAKAANNATDYAGDGTRLELFQEAQLRLSDDHKQAIALLEKIAQTLNVTQPPHKGRAFAINTRMTINLLNLGEIRKAETYVKRNVALLSEARTWPNAGQYLSVFEANMEDSRARLLLARGQYAEAELAFGKAEERYRDALGKSRAWSVRVPAASLESGIDYAAAFAGRAKVGQGRATEAEIDIRRALLSRLRAGGKYHADTAN